MVMRAEVVHRAPEDGFVIATSGGVQTGVIFEGATPDTLVRRTRFNKYGNATLPVRKGRYWRVDPRRGNGTPIVVRWSPAP